MTVAHPSLLDAQVHSLMLWQNGTAAARATWVSANGPSGNAAANTAYVAAVALQDQLHLDRTTAASIAFGDPAPVVPSARPQRSGAQGWLTTKVDSGA